MMNIGVCFEVVIVVEMVKYEMKIVQMVCGIEKFMIFKWEKDGWELVIQNFGKFCMELVFC